MTVPTTGSEENRQSIIHQGHERIAQEEIPTAQDTILQNDTLQNIDDLNLLTPIDLSLDDDSPNEEDVNNSDEHSDSSLMDDLESNNIQAPIIQNEDALFLRRAEGHSVQFVNKKTITSVKQHWAHQTIYCMEYGSAKYCATEYGNIQVKNIL